MTKLPRANSAPSPFLCETLQNPRSKTARWQAVAQPKPSNIKYNQSNAATTNVLTAHPKPSNITYNQSPYTSILHTAYLPMPQILNTIKASPNRPMAIAQKIAAALFRFLTISSLMVFLSRAEGINVWSPAFMEMALTGHPAIHSPQ